MEKFKPYKPSKEEVAKAESMMTPEEKKMTEKRAEEIESSEVLKQGDLLGNQLVLTERNWSSDDIPHAEVELIWGNKVIFRFINYENYNYTRNLSPGDFFDLLIEKQIDPRRASLNNSMKAEEMLKPWQKEVADRADIKVAKILKKLTQDEIDALKRHFDTY